MKRLIAFVLIASTAFAQNPVAISGKAAISGKVAITHTTASAQTPAFVQIATSNGSTGTSEATAFASNNAAGGLIVVVAEMNTTLAASTASISDSQGNSYSSGVSVDCNVSNCGGGVQSYKIWYAPNVHAGANTVTLTDSQSTFHEIIIAEFSGVAATSPSDGTCAWAQSVTATSESCSITASAAGGLAIGVAQDNGGSYTAGSGFTIRAIHFIALESQEAYSGTSVVVAVSSTATIRALIGQAFKPGP